MRATAARRAGIAAATLAVAALLVSSLVAPATTSAAPGLTITVVNNNSDYAADQVFVLAQAGGTEVVADPQPLSSRDSFTTASIRSGRVFISFGRPLPAVGEPSPDTSDIRYDTVELTYPGVANLTAVDMFGIPLDLEVLDAQGNVVGAKRWGCYTDVVRDTLSRSLTAAGGDFSKTVRTDDDGGFLRLVSPNIVSGLHPSGYPRFDSYVESLSGVPLTVRGQALGQSYEFVGAFQPDPDDPGGPGSLTLVDQGPDDLLPIQVSGRSLVGNSGNDTNGIYGNNSPYLVGGEPHSGNDVYSAAYRDLVAGFAYGFWGSPAYGNDTALFDVSSAPGPFAAAQPTAPHYNVWAAALWPLTDAYGFPYGDTFNDAPERNPIVELPTDGTLRITIQPDTSPPTCAAGGATPTPSTSASPTTSPTGEPVDPDPSGPPTPKPTATSPTPRLSPPGRPTGLRVAKRGRDRVTLAWSAPERANTASLEYVIQAKVRSRCLVLDQTIRTAVQTRTRKAWRGRSVAYRVLAHDTAGTGPASRPTRLTFPRGDTPLGPLGDNVGRPCKALGWGR